MINWKKNSGVNILGIYDDAMQLLTGFYDFHKKGNSVGYNPGEWSNLLRQDREETIRAIEYLLDKKLVTVSWGKDRCPYLISLTSADIDQIENPMPAASSTMTVGTNTGVIVHGSHHITVNNGINLAQLSALIEQNLSNHPDLIEARLMLNVLQKERTLEKGLLSHFSGLLERHSWLSGAVAQTILQLLVSIPR